MHSLSSDIGAQLFSRLSPSKQKDVALKFSVLASALEAEGIDARARLWRLVQFAYPEQEQLWTAVGHAESLTEAELEDEINELYDRIENNPEDSEAVKQLRELQMMQAHSLSERFRAMLPVESGKISELLNRARSVLDVRTSDRNPTE